MSSLTGDERDLHTEMKSTSLAISHGPLETFHVFPLLPTELRLKIWEHTLPPARVLEVVWSANQKEWSYVRQSRNEPYYAMRANKEAHDNYRKKWSSFCLLQSKDSTSSAGLPFTYINPEMDTVYIGAGPQSDFCFSSDAVNGLLALPRMSQLRYLACEIIEWHQNTSDPDKMGKAWELGFLVRFPSLEEFIIVDYDIDWTWMISGKERPDGTIELVEPTQMDEKNDQEMWPKMLRRFEKLRRLEEGKGLPQTIVKEIQRGGVTMTYT